MFDGIHDLQSKKRNNMGKVFLLHCLLHGGIVMFTSDGFPDVLEWKSSISFFHLLNWCITSSPRLCFKVLTDLISIATV